MAKAEVNLNWLWTIDYGLFWLHIYIHAQCSLFDTNTSFITGFMISLFFTAPTPRVRRASGKLFYSQAVYWKLGFIVLALYSHVLAYLIHSNQFNSSNRVVTFKLFKTYAHIESPYKISRWSFGFIRKIIEEVFRRLITVLRTSPGRGLEGVSWKTSWKRPTKGRRAFHFRLI